MNQHRKPTAPSLAKSPAKPQIPPPATTPPEEPTRAQSQPEKAAAEEQPVDGRNCAANAGAAQETDPIFKKFGPPFVPGANGNPRINERAVAAKCANDELIRYDSVRGGYLRYDETVGLWKEIVPVQVKRLLNALLSNLTQQFEPEEFVPLITSARLHSLERMLQVISDEAPVSDSAGLHHVSNGVLDLRGDEPVLLPHDPKYRFTESSGVRYNPDAKCIRFEEQLLAPALTSDDAKLVPIVFGAILLGMNVAHVILLIRGAGGTGKSTLLWVLEKILGESVVAHLRTNHLLGRFEMSAFVGKQLLVGSDVQGDALTHRGARLLKSLTGGDLLEAEPKYAVNKKRIRGDYHVVLTSNSRLRIALEGDEEAWQRRLVIIDFVGTKPACPIPNFAEMLVSEEASGILNWLIAGAMQYRKALRENGKLPLSEAQRQRIRDLLTESDTVRGFVKERVVAEKGGAIRSESLLKAYCEFCDKRAFEPVGADLFYKRVSSVLRELFQVSNAHDMLNNGMATRGYRGVCLN